jgi:hypothetical protein
MVYEGMNQYEQYAVGIYLKGNRSCRLGYLERNRSSRVSAYVEGGHAFDASVLEFRTYSGMNDVETRVTELDIVGCSSGPKKSKTRPVASASESATPSASEMAIAAVVGWGASANAGGAVRSFFHAGNQTYTLSAGLLPQGADRGASGHHQPHVAAHPFWNRLFAWLPRRR